MVRHLRVLALVLVWVCVACAKPPVVNVAAQPCECECSFKATAPQIGKGCWVQNDVLICPLVKRTLEIEPAYPDADPRCERQPDGTLRCEVEP